MRPIVIEAVSFRLVEGVSHEDFLKAVAASEAFIAGNPGFLSRRVSAGADGEWLDYVEWESMEAAMAAGEKFVAEPCVAPLMQAIDQSTLVMRHHHLVA